MTKNVLILTTGLSGSSLLTGLISKAGYWTVESTIYKNNSTGRYETYENSKLVELNNQLLEEAKVSFDSNFWYEDSSRAEIARAGTKIARDNYQAFVETCATHQPWIWKDPKLWITLGFWLQMLDTSSLKCIVLNRNIKRLWLSQTHKRIIYDYRYLKESEKHSRDNLTRFLCEQDVDYITMNYESLQHNTTVELNRINNFLSTNLALKDWDEIYQPKEVSMIDNMAKIFKAILIYVTNYRQRIKGY